MSKAKKRQRREVQLCFIPPAPVRPDKAVEADIMRAASTPYGELPPEIMAVVRETANGVATGIVGNGTLSGFNTWDDFKNYTWKDHRNPVVQDENEFILQLIEQATASGFRIALTRYARQLKAVPELAAWHRTRAAAGKKGRATQSTKKQTRQSEATRMIGQGLTEKEIAERFSVNVSTVYRWLKPAPKSPAKVRKTTRQR
jgi:hypothetical protein